MNRGEKLIRNVKWMTWFFILGLFVSGLTAIPLRAEVDLLVKWSGVSGASGAAAPSGLGGWLLSVQDALRDTEARHEFLFYGTDWLAFGHFVIAIVFLERSGTRFAIAGYTDSD